MNQQEQIYLLVKEWKQSDLTKVEFSTIKPLSYHQFNYWLKKYNKEMDLGPCKTEVSFFSATDNPRKDKKQSASKETNRKTMRIDLPG